MLSETEIIKKLDAIKRSTTSNDPVDVIGEELAIATIMKRYADKRRDNAVEDMIAHDPDTIAKTKTKAVVNSMKTEHMWRGKEMVIAMSCNAPAERSDPAAFYNELIKLGVSKDIVDKAKAKSMKRNAPATSFIAVRAED